MFEKVETAVSTIEIIQVNVIIRSGKYVNAPHERQRRQWPLTLHARFELEPEPCPHTRWVMSEQFAPELCYSGASQENVPHPNRGN
jgi:hypothetical protein